MRAIQYVRSVPRYLAARSLGRAWSGLYVSPLSLVRLVDVESPTLPGPEWARIRPVLSGICGSDLATITAHGSPYFSPFTSTPFVLGHEVVGEVVEVGGNVDSADIGDRVVLAPPLHCEVRGIDERCAACRAGEIGHCTNVTGGEISAGIQTGYCRDTGGGWSEGFVAHRRQIRRVPAALPEEAAVLIEPFSCCLHAVHQAALSDDQVVLVLGSGTIGALTIAAIRALGSRARIIAVAKHPHQQKAVRDLGADDVIATSGKVRVEIADALRAELYRPEIGPPVAVGGADVCFDCVGSSRTLDDAMRFTRAKGTVIVVGMPGVPKGIDWTAMWHKELEIHGSYTCSDETFEHAVGIAPAVADRLAPLVGATFPLEEYRTAIRCALDTGRSGVIKTAFRPT